MEDIFLNEKTSDISQPLATFQQRFMAALFFDYLVPILMIFAGTMLQIFNGGMAFSIIAGVLVQVLGLLVIFGLNAVAPSKNHGQSISKKRQNIAIMVIDDPEKWTLRMVGEEDLGRLLLRTLVGWIEAFIIFPGLIPFLLISSNNNNQRLADKVAKTVVVQVDPGKFPDEKAVKAKEKEKAKAKEKAKKKKGKPGRVTVNNAQFVQIARYALIGTSIMGILYYFFFVLTGIIILVNNTLVVYASASFINYNVYRGFRTTFVVFQFLAFAVMVGSLVLLYLGLDEQLKQAILFTVASFGVYVLVMIIYISLRLSNAGTGKIVGAIDGNLIVVTWNSIVVVIFNTLAVIIFIVALFYLGKVFQQSKELYQTKAGRILISPILLAVLYFLYLLVFIIGAAIFDFSNTVSNAIFFYLYLALRIFVDMTYMLIYGILSIKFLRFNPLQQ
ncbi:MAG: hypothetical protein GF308_02595 [Candidatus Heimdallarchaeota archaeon]|nr:hypothetical protein [Candidatus Heimdallarchaeota archaeon]